MRWFGFVVERIFPQQLASLGNEKKACEANDEHGKSIIQPD